MFLKPIALPRHVIRVILTSHPIHLTGVPPVLRPSLLPSSLLSLTHKSVTFLPITFTFTLFSIFNLRCFVTDAGSQLHHPH